MPMYMRAGTYIRHVMIIVGLPYYETCQTTMEEISGGSPYGVTTIAGSDGGRMPSENELAMARFQGCHVATIVKNWRANSPQCPRIADVEAGGVQHSCPGVRFRGPGLYLEETAISRRDKALGGITWAI